MSAMREACGFQQPGNADCATRQWADLGRRFAAGDREAAEEVVRHYQPILARRIARLLSDRALVDDVLQDTLVRAIERCGQFRGDSLLETWLTRIALNCCRHRQRREAARRWLFAAWLLGQPQRAATGDARDELQVNQRAERVRRAVERLPVKYREVTVLFYLEELGGPEIAEVLGISPSAVRRRLVRAREKLADLLSDLSPET